MSEQIIPENIRGSHINPPWFRLCRVRLVCVSYIKLLSKTNTNLLILAKLHEVFYSFSDIAGVTKANCICIGFGRPSIARGDYASTAAGHHRKLRSDKALCHF
jgi:hypothetical protein